MITSKYVKTGETKKYSMFISPAHQRDINNNSIKSIMESMKEHGIISAVSTRKSLIHKGKYEVFDGQHTVEACKRLNLPVIYNEFTDVSNKAMISLNGKSKKWAMGDYLKFGVTDGIKDYMLLDKIYKKERLPLTALIMMYGGSYGNKSFKDLKWKALTISRGSKILEYIKEIETTFNIKHVRFARFIWGFGRVIDSGKYDHNRMIYQLGKCSSMLTKQANPEDYTSNIEMVYNYGVKKENRVQFTQK
tara:strand:- start:1963 stop:2706 length:744 start_codon:yes stop_codon:yes gene_type:complete